MAQRGNSSNLAAALSIEKPDRKWGIRRPMVTGGTRPAASVFDRRIPICAMADLKQVILEGLEKGTRPSQR